MGDSLETSQRSTRHPLAVTSLLFALLHLPAVWAQPSTGAATLKAGTVVVLISHDAFNPRKARLGDAHEFWVYDPVVVDGHIVLKHHTAVHGRITALKPNPEITLDPVVQEGVTIAFTGHPYERKPVKSASGNEPRELAIHDRSSAAAKVGMVEPPVALALLVASPVLVPMLIVDKIKHRGTIDPGTQSAVMVAADTAIPADALLPVPYDGLPIIYVLDRWEAKNNSVLCGVDTLSPSAFMDDLNLRVAPGRYVFHAPDPLQSAAAVEAKAGDRFLVFRDRTGFHSVDLAGRPDLLDFLPVPESPGQNTGEFQFDESKSTPAQVAAQQESRSHGGCGIILKQHRGGAVFR